MEANGLSNNSSQTSLKQRVQVDDIKVIDLGFQNIVNSTMKEFTMPMPVPVLHGVPTEYDICTNWKQSQVTSANSAFRWKPIF